MFVKNRLIGLMGCVLLTNSAFAAAPMSLRHSSWEQVKQYFDTPVPGLLRANGASAQGNQLRVVSEQVLPQISHVRMQQYYRGFLVRGGYAIIHGQGSLPNLLSTNSSINGEVYQNLAADLGDTPVDFVSGGSKALEEIKKKFPADLVAEEHVDSIIYIDKNHKAHWAYQIYLLIQHEEKIPQKINVIVDAITLEYYAKWNDIKTVLQPAQAKGYGGNPNLKKTLYGGKKYEALTVSRDPGLKKCYLSNDIVQVRDMRHKWNENLLGFLVSFDCTKPTGPYWTGIEGNGLDASNGGFSPSNDAAYQGMVVHEMYKKWFGLDVLKTNKNKPMQLILRVHFGKGYENAYWDGRQMTFGDGGDMVYPLVSVGITAHEISHGFTEQHSNLEYFGEAGGINESFSDMASKTAELYSDGKIKNWNIGSEIVKPNSGLVALRYMNIPSRDGQSIDKATDYYEGLNVHHSSGAFNRFFFLLSNSKGWTARKAFEVMIEANMNYWTPSTTFQEAGCGVLDAAKAKNYPILAIKNAMTKIGLDYTIC